MKTVFIVYHDNMFSIGVEGVFTKRGSAVSFARRMNKRNKRKDGNFYSVSYREFRVLTRDGKDIVKEEARFA